jgi:hypothetical protein
MWNVTQLVIQSIACEWFNFPPQGFIPLPTAVFATSDRVALPGYR